MLIWDHMKKIEDKQLLDTFIDLVKTDSVSGEEEAVKYKLKVYLKEAGMQVKEDNYGNLIGKKEGKGDPVILSAHMDTVEPGRGIEPEIKGDIIQSKGESVLAADDKAGITEIIEAIKFLNENEINHRPVEILFTKEEEVGLKGAFNVDPSDFRSREILIFDGQGKPLTICSAAPYITSIDIEVKGKLAHAGVVPEKGLNAIYASSKAISRVKWGRIDKETTTNVGIIEGGTARNSVPEKVLIKAEARSHNKEKMKKRVEMIKKAFKEAVESVGAKVKIDAKEACSGYKLKENDPFLKGVLDTAKGLGIKPELITSGGASDANALAGKGFKVLDISYGGEGAHTTKEKLRISWMRKTTEFLVEYLRMDQSAVS